MKKKAILEAIKTLHKAGIIEWGRNGNMLMASGDFTLEFDESGTKQTIRLYEDASQPAKLTFDVTGDRAWRKLFRPAWKETKAEGAAAGR